MKKIILILVSWCLIIICLAKGEVDSNKIISFDFKKIAVRELLQFIAESMHYNIIISENVSGFLSLHFQNITWNDALNGVLEMAGLAKKIQGNILFIDTAAEFASRQKLSLDISPMKTINLKLKHIDVSQIEPVLKLPGSVFSPNAKLTINLAENSLWLKEIVQNLPAAIQYIHQLDQAQPQILITAKIINIDSNKAQELGINLEMKKQPSAFNDLFLSLPQEGGSCLKLAIATLAQNQLLNLQLDALQALGHSHVIANPRIITQNRKTAVIEAGEEVPYQESTASGATSTVFKKAALSLRVKPTLLPDGRITLELEVNQNKISALAVNGTPAIQTQELKTEVIVRDRQTVILGGISERSSADLTRKIPILADIPLFGPLLAHESHRGAVKQLLILISPQVLNNCER